MYLKSNGQFVFVIVFLKILQVWISVKIRYCFAWDDTTTPHSQGRIGCVMRGPFHYKIPCHYIIWNGDAFQTNTRRWTSCGLMLDQRLRRWSIIKPPLVQRHVFWVGLVFNTPPGGGPRVVVSTAAFPARVRGSVPGLGVWKKQKCFFPIHVWKLVLWGASVTER